MTVATTNSTSGPYLANGVTTTFRRGFYADQEDDLIVSVEVDEGFFVIGQGITHTDIGQDEGDVIFDVAPPDGAKVLIERRTDLDQSTDYNGTGDVYPSQIENDFDKAFKSLQEIRAAADRSFKKRLGATAIPPGNLVKVDNNGELVDTGTSIEAIMQAISNAGGGGGGGGGTGDVSGPASSEDGEIPAYSGTSGKQIGRSGRSLTDIYKRYDFPHQVRSAIASGEIEDGERFYLADEPMVRDDTLENDYGSRFFNVSGDSVPGVRCLNPFPLNLYGAIGFPTQDDNKLQILVSNDRINMYPVNKNDILRGGGDSTIGGRDSQYYWHEETGEVWAPVTSGQEVTTHDFSMFRSIDGGMTWGLSRGFLDANSPEGMVRGKMVPGGEVAVYAQWSNAFYKFEGRTYIITSLGVLPKENNAFGNLAPRLRPYVAELIDADDNGQVKFGPVTPMDIGPANEAKLNPDVIHFGGEYWCCIKNSPERKCEVWRGPSLTATFSKETEIDLDPTPGNLDSLEGNTWAVHRYIDPNDPDRVLVKVGLHLSNNRNENDELVGSQLFTESTTGGPAGPYGPIIDLNVETETRNYKLTNLALNPDPRAVRTFQSMIAYYGGQGKFRVHQTQQLKAGTDAIVPLDDFVYYITGAAGSTTLSFRKHVADRFFVAVLNTNPGAKVTIEAGDNARPIVIGGGRQEYVEFVWMPAPHEKYVPIGRFDDAGVSSSTQLAAGTSDEVPRLNVEYFILGAAGSTVWSINERGADSFFVAVHNTDPGATIELAATSFCRAVTVGGGRQEIIRMVWSNQIGKYMAEGRHDNGSGGADGVVNSASYQDASSRLTLGRTVGASLPVDLGDLRENEPVILLGLGQSNMDQNATATGGVREVYPGIFVWNGTATSNGSAFSQAAFGSAPFNVGSANSQLLSAANLIKQTTGRDVYIILIAEGGRAIECFIKPATRTANGWSTPANEITPFMYPQIANAIAEVPRRHRSVVDAIHFQHGEANGGDLAYSDKLVDGLISDLESEGVFSQAHGYFAAGGLVPDNSDYAVHKAEVEAAEAVVPNLIYVNSVNLSDSGDNVHFDGEGLLAMGNRCVVQGAILSGVFPVPVAKLEGDLRIILNEIGSRTWAIEKDGDLIFLAHDNSRDAGQIGQDSHRLSRVVTDTVRMDAPSGSNHDLSMMENGILAMGGSPVGTKYDWKALGSISGTLTLSSIGATRKAVFNMTGNVNLDITGMTDQTEIELNVLNSDAFDFSVSITSGNLMYANGVRPQDLAQQFAKVYIQREAGRYFVTCADYEVI